MRKTHSLPESLDEPPEEWATLYQALADECGIKLTMPQAFGQLNQFYLEHVVS